jgi:hypothetical protein
MIIIYRVYNYAAPMPKDLSRAVYPVLNFAGCLFGMSWGSWTYGGGAFESRMKDDGFCPFSQCIAGGNRIESSEADELCETRHARKVTNGLPVGVIRASGSFRVRRRRSKKKIIPQMRIAPRTGPTMRSI